MKSYPLFLSAVILGAISGFAAEPSFKSAKLCFEIKNSRDLNSRSFGKWSQYENVSIQGNGEIICDNTVKVAKHVGVRQYITLNQSKPMPITFSAESKCESPEKKDGKPGYKYSIYLDIKYTDGTARGGIIAPFNIGTHDWEKAERTYTPEKPIKRLLYVLFYMRPGKAWFRNVSLIAQTALKGKIFINGREIGEVPANASEEFRKVSVEISKEQLSALATVNIVNIENAPKYNDLFTIKNVFLEVTDSKGNVIKSNVAEGAFTSFKTGFANLENGKKEYTYYGAPLPEIKLVLPKDKTGHIETPAFERKTGDLYRDNTRKKWPGLENAALSGPKRTLLTMRPHEFCYYPKEYIMDMMGRYNADILNMGYYDRLLDNRTSQGKIAFLRKHGIKISLMYSNSKLRNPYDRLPESDKYKQFFKVLAEWAPLVDVVNMDEWYLSPAMLKTEGANVTPITEKFIKAFEKWSGYSRKDTQWAFKNYTSDDPRALKAWEFCAKVQNDFVREFVRVAKKANPKIRTCISYITKNWNKSISCIDSGVKDFDEILQCQTYWFGRAAKDPLDSPLVTAPIGMGKIYKAEHPDKFLWCGVDPFYTGGKGYKKKESWQNTFYETAPEEVVPYLALLYASSDGIFIQNPAGKQIFQFQFSEKLKNHYRSRLGVDGAYVDRFADTVSLVSKLVPFIKSYRKSDVAYYYDPDADWEITRRVNRYVAARETNEISVGLLQGFCDVDVTKDVSKYKNVIYAGLLLPSKFNYSKQNIYLMYAPEYDEKGNKVPEAQLFSKLNIKGFAKMGGNFFRADGTENGCMDMFKIASMGNTARANGRTITGAAYPVRTASCPVTGGKPYLICARNKAGNVLVNSLWPSFVTQNLAGKVIKEDLNYFKWTKRDCPQVNGTDKIVAVAFRKPRTAVLDFGQKATFKKVKLVMFNGKDGVTRNETVSY
ncbi:MAG: hypothetical protein WC082_08510, partial [Victivallales bacterium]